MTTLPRSTHADREPARWRVILVGRTGLDQALRRDPGFELVRSRGSLDAVGELSDPIDGSSPDNAVVVVAPSAEPSGLELDGFHAALRRVDPGVLVLRVGEEAPGYHGSVRSDASASDLRRVIDQAARMPRIVPEISEAPTAMPVVEPTPEPVSEPVPEVEPQVERPVEPEAPEPSVHDRVMNAEPAALARSDAPGDDAEIVRALLGGRSIIDPMLEIARSRAERADLYFDAKMGRLVCDDRAWTDGAGAGMMASLTEWVGSWTRLEAQHRELRQAAFTDHLTGAWNRRYFDRFMGAAIEQARLARRPLTVMVFDIDNFKKYNDKYGHGAGDSILIETVRLLASVIRPSDRVCRIGGDEFAVVFYEPEGPRHKDSAPPEAVNSIAARFQKQICTHRFPKLGAEAAGNLTISGGLATFPWDGSTPESLLERADELSMQSKRQGKNALTFGPGATRVCGENPDGSCDS